MDPDAALREARALAAELLADADADPAAITPQAALDLAERFQALDGWLSAGSFLPEPWAPGTIRAAAPTDWAQFAHDMRDGSPQALARHLPPEVRDAFLGGMRRCPVDAPGGHPPHPWKLTTEGSRDVEFFTCPGSPDQGPGPVGPQGGAR
jgi:hypothetical protein